MYLTLLERFMAQKLFKRLRKSSNLIHVAVSALYVIELLFIHKFSDLPIEVSNWIYKADQLAAFNIPADNFYGPGGAILILPFLWARNNLFVCIIFYAFIGAFFYSKIIQLISNQKLRIIGYLGLFSNVYLLWLINSSQDTVFEFFLLLSSMYFFVSKKYLPYTALMFLLCLTRSGYWTLFIVLGLIEAGRYIFRREMNFKKILAFPLLALISIFNLVNYGSASPALESGMTAYFAYSKYHYLSLPKMDMDVFLSGENGIFSEKYGIPHNDVNSGSEENSKFLNEAIKSAKHNPKETILGWMQKIDSYVFDAQKVPHLPGRYELDLQTKSIEIKDERLSWVLVGGNFLYFFMRGTLFLATLISIGIWIALRDTKDSFRLTTLAFPWLVGLVPGVLFYTETRFKIVSELLIIPLILEIYSKFVIQRKLQQKNY